MAAGSTLTLRVINPTASSNALSVTVTLGTADWPDAKTAVQQFSRAGGIWGDDGVFYPYSAILQISIS